MALGRRNCRGRRTGIRQPQTNSLLGDQASETPPIKGDDGQTQAWPDPSSGQSCALGQIDGAQTATAGDKREDGSAWFRLDFASQPDLGAGSSAKVHLTSSGAEATEVWTLESGKTSCSGYPIIVGSSNLFAS